VALINRVPAGLLSLLGIRAGGVNPASLSETVQSVIDLTDLYLAGYAERIIAVANIAAVGSFVPVPSVPENEFWIVREYGIVSPTLTAGQALLVTPTYVHSIAGVLRHFPVGNPSNLGAAGDVVTASSRAPFVASPGAALGCQVNRLTAGPVNGAVFAVTFTRLGV